MITISGIPISNILIGEVPGWDFSLEGYDLDKPHYLYYKKDQEIIRANLTWGVNKILTITQNSSNIDLVNDRFNVILHGLYNNNRISFKSSSTLPGGIVQTQFYYVVQASVNSFKISATLGGAAVDLLNLGSGTLTISCNKYAYLPAAVNTVLHQFSIADHLLVDGDQISFDSTPGGFVAWPIEIGRTYYVINSSSGTFQISETLAGPVFNFINQGSGIQTYLKDYGSENLVKSVVFEQSANNGSSYQTIGEFDYDYGNLGKLIGAFWT